ncbi:MAG TPA: hypothetical protein VGQ21_05980, partial [Thermoanaerobaculia bacterium]|nr:hypothetical protein [Thermoanaerobaculia bacterium]
RSLFITFALAVLEAEGPRTSESDESGTPAGDQLVGSDQFVLVAPVHVRVIANDGAARQTAITDTRRMVLDMDEMRRT